MGGYLANLGHGIGEWAAQGGTVTLGGKEVVAQSDSRMNLAGGTLDVAEGVINLSWLRGADGRLYEASSAPADRVYAGLYRGYEDLHGRWGEKATRRFLNPVLAPSTRREAGYTVGRDAGRLVLSAPTAVVESEIVATVYDGARQTQARAAGTDGYGQGQLAVARAGGLALGNYGALGRVNVFNTDVKLGRYADITLAMDAGDALARERVGTLWLDSARLSDMGLGALDLATGGALTVAQAVALADGGQAALTAGRIDAQAGITARGGAITLSNTFVSPDASVKARALSKAGEAPAIVLREGAALDVSESLGGLAGQGRGLAVAGPARRRCVTLDSPHGIAVAAGSLIDVSSGGAVLHKGETRAGKGGDVTLRAGAPEVEGAKGALALAGQLRGYGMAGGGTLMLETDGKVVIGGVDALANRQANTPTGAAQPQPLLLDPSLLRAGFAKYDINSRGGLRVAEGATLDVAMPVYRYEPGNEATGQRPAPALLLAPVYQENPLKGALTQRAGADLTLRSQRIDDGADIDIGVGARVSVDPGRTIRLLGGGNSRITVDGALRAPGEPHRGGYRRAGLRCARQPREQDAQPRHLDRRRGDAGCRRPRRRWRGHRRRRYGQAQAGGSILLGGALDWDATGIAESARDIAIVVRPGAVLDASGSRLAIDAPRGSRLGTLDLAGDGEPDRAEVQLWPVPGWRHARPGGRRGRGRRHAGAGAGNAHVPAVGQRRGRRAPAARTDPVAGHAGQRPGIGSQAGAARSGAASWRGAPVGAAVRGRRLRQPVAAGQRDSQFRRRRGPVGLAKPALLCRQLCRDRPRDGRHGRQPVRAASTAGRRGARPGDGVTPTVTWRDGASARPGVGSFTADADLIDIRDRVGFGARGAVPLLAGAPVTVDRRGFDQVSLNSRGDVRLLGGQAGRGLSGDATTELGTNGDLRITSAQLYPATGASATIWGGYETAAAWKSCASPARSRWRRRCRCSAR
ncbi:hypothetical protein WJ970_24850 [Achromobacter xylosoxidans]